MAQTQRFLAVDVGNTRLKATLLPSASGMRRGAEAEMRTFDPEDVEGLMEWVDTLCAEEEELACGLAAVGHIDPRLAESLRNRLGDDRFLLITPATELPIETHYTTPHTLGLDRKATACAAAALCRGARVMVIDAGSAVTIDHIAPNGDFIGGSISPGLSMRFRALHDYTAGLPLVEAASRLERDYGTNTRSAIIAGVEGGWLDEIDAAIRRGIAGGAECVLLCGGDAPLLMRLLGNPRIEVQYVPHLVAIGIREIYRHHDKN